MNFLPAGLKQEELKLSTLLTGYKKCKVKRSFKALKQLYLIRQDALE
jgi:hypothetical protein